MKWRILILALVLCACSTPPRALSAVDCPSWITISSRPSAATYYDMVSCKWSETGTSVYLSVLDAGGAPVSGINVHQRWPDGNISQVTQGGVTSFAMGASGCDPDAGRPGALEYYVDSPQRSVVAKGFCLPLNRHFDFYVTFRERSGATPTPSVTPTPGPTPIPGTALSKQDAIGILTDIRNVCDKWINALK